jgi:hypothetical protein
VAATSKDTPARRALPQTGPSGDHKILAAARTAFGILLGLHPSAGVHW